VVVDLNDGRSLSAPLAWYPRLLHGTPEERGNWRLIGSGEGVHWPDLDEDLSIESLISGRPSGESQESLKRWLELRSHMGNSSAFEAARNKYRPDQIELLFIAEAPPAYDPQRFFYFVPVDRGDALFLEMMKVLYPNRAKFIDYGDDRKPAFNAKQVRDHKGEFLEKFKQDGFYLIDAVDEPMPRNATGKMKEEKIRSSLRGLKDKVKALCGDRDVPVALLGALVYKICAPDLRAGGVRVLNEDKIRIPAQGGQKEFRRKLGDLLRSHQVKTSDSCS
jgi:hypothetical protein